MDWVQVENDLRIRPTEAGEICCKNRASGGRQLPFMANHRAATATVLSIPRTRSTPKCRQSEQDAAIRLHPAQLRITWSKVPAVELPGTRRPRTAESPAGVRKL